MCYKVISKILANHLKYVTQNLVGPEQSGFLPWYSTFDNIIATQEIAHSIETDTSLSPRMIDKMYIEKAFDTVEWKVILTTP